MSNAPARTIDLSGKTVLPGMIDMHVHLLAQFEPGNPVLKTITRTSDDQALNDAAYARPGYGVVTLPLADVRDRADDVLELLNR